MVDRSNLTSQSSVVCLCVCGLVEQSVPVLQAQPGVTMLNQCHPPSEHFGLLRFSSLKECVLANLCCSRQLACLFRGWFRTRVQIEDPSLCLALSHSPFRFKNLDRSREITFHVAALRLKYANIRVNQL